MLKPKNVGGWVLALVALSLFAGLLLRRLTGNNDTAPENQISADMVMTGNQRASALDLSAAFEAITAQYLPVVVKINSPYPNYSSTSFTGGCGILVSNDGYSLTNSFFTLGDSVEVRLYKGRRFSGWIAGSDPQTNLALIKIAAKGLPYAKLGDSDRLRIGQWVMAIGNTGESMPAITAAIINAKGRSKVSLPELDDFIQIDVPIQQVNSGGALVSLDGDLVGITTTLPGHSGGGLAIPANLARRVMQSLMKEGAVTRGYIGATAQDIDQNLAKALKLASALGALIVEVAANGPAERAGLRRGDVILQFANVPIANANDFENAVASQTPAKTVQAVVWRDSVKVICEVATEARPTMAQDESSLSTSSKPVNKLGIQVRNVPLEMSRLHNVQGVAISYLNPHSPATHVLSTGDIIQEINRRPIRGMRDFNAALQGLQTGEVALLLVRRSEKNFYSGVEVQE
jgi:serine protease Do